MTQLSKIQEFVHEACGLSNSADQAIALGNTCPAEIFSLVEETMIEHIPWFDQKLRAFKMLKEFPKKLLQERGFTYAEYLELFDTKKPVDIRKPVYKILGLATEQARSRFITNNKPHEAHYLKNLYETGATVAIQFFSPMPAHLSAGKLLRHCYIAAQNGSGKTELLKLMLYSLQKQSQSKRDKAIVLLDPHGDIAHETFAFHLNKETDRVLFIDPNLHDGYTPVLNPFYLTDRSLNAVDIYAQTLAKTFQELLPEAEMTLQMTSILIPCIATLLLREGSTLKDLQRFMQDDQDLIALGKKSPFPAHREFFETAFEEKSYDYTKSGIYTRIQSLLNQSAFYRMTCGGTNTIDLESAIDAGKVIIFRFTKSHGIEASIAMNKFVIARLLSLVLQRASKPKNSRKPVFLAVDEFQNYVSPSISTIVEESRKFGLHLIISHQNLAQIKDTNFRRSILSNTHVKIIGTNGYKDLKEYSQELNIKVEDLQTLPPFHFFARIGNSTAFLFKSNDMLIDQKPPFYLNENQLAALKKQMITNGYYRPDYSDQQSHTAPNAPAPPSSSKESEEQDIMEIRERVNQRSEELNPQPETPQKTKNEKPLRKGFTTPPSKPLRPKFDF